MKAPTRFPIFSYSTFASTLLTDTKSLEIKLRSKFVSLEMLFELESLLAWCSAHPEILSIYFTVYGDDFIQGINQEDLKKLDSDKLKKILNKFTTISQALFCLPQTVIMDLKKGAKGIGVEFALCADIRVSDKIATFTLDHLQYGLTPCCGLFSFLVPYINQNMARSLILSGKTFDVEAFGKLGGYVEVETSYKEILKTIFSQAPVARTQAKHGLLGDNFTNKLDEKIQFERKIFNATLMTGDYSTNEGEFMSHNDFKDKIEVLSEINQHS